ncbi:Scr1 family TA system antitoxin-like transcriptional regulator [Streptomyces sp. NPDC052013]|uniref:helix-turn-helix domain-containing protein n=1 Tax=unclassified Streptomyces TaxID=2593676 RepID=UPI00344DF3DE
MTGVMNGRGQETPGPRQGSVYRWDIHHLSDGRHQQGPCGTSTSEAGARACIEAALSAAVGPDAYAWGLLSRIPASTEEGAPQGPLTPLAWAAPNPEGTVAWLVHAGRPRGEESGGQAPPAVEESIGSLLARFGREVSRYRLIAGYTRAELAAGTACPEGTVELIENARHMPSYDFARRADRLLGTDGALVALWPSLVRPAYPDWFWHVIELERQAGFIQEFESVAIPGLLQTQAYARAICTAAHPVAPELEIEQFVAARIDRQRILTRREPPQVMVTLDEGVLRRCVGGSRVMSEQLAHLLDLAALPRIHLQVIPFHVREHPGGMTPFRIMGFREGPDVLYGETFIGGQTTIDAGQVQQHKLAFNLIQSKALSLDDSQVLIRDLKEELGRAAD